MKRSCGVIIFVVFILFGLNAHAGAGFDISPGVGYLTGDSTYAIGNVPPGLDPWGRDPYFPISELKFPLGVYLATLDARMTIGIVEISGGIKRNITDKAGHMRDYDWGVPFWDAGGDEGPGWYVNKWENGTNEWYMLDIQSASKSELDVTIWNAKFACLLFNHRYNQQYRDMVDRKIYHHSGELSVSLGVGYEVRSFDYENKLIRQWSPSGIPGYDYTGDGSVGITYDVDYSIPYIELGVANRGEKIDFDMGFGYSAYVRAKDKDVHLARIPGPIYAKGDCDGQAYKFNAGLQYNFTPQWYLKGAFDYLYIRTHGEQFNYILAGTSDGHPWDSDEWITDERIISRQSFFSVNAGYRFNLP